jgi:pimeloyl-ACP methyl ester carboxylesterase
MGKVGEEIEAGGLQIWFERNGTGPHLILLHGALSDSREWRRQLDSLSDDFTVVAWDAPGCGRSSDPPETFRLPDYADCLMAFIRKAGIERPCILGLSFGGGLALEFYRRYPAVPERLVLVSAYAGWKGSLPPEIVAERLEMALQDSEKPPGKLVDSMIPTLFSRSVSAELIDEIKAIMSGFHPSGLRTMARAFSEADLRDVLPRISIPTLLLYGEDDKRAPLDVARKLHAEIPGSRLVVIPGAGHQINMEAPEEFDAEVRVFLSSHRA